MAKKANTAGKLQANNSFVVEKASDETGAEALARKILEPHLRHAITASAFAGQVLGANFEGPGVMDYVRHEQAVTTKAESGNLAIASQLLASQAVTLDSMFTELARRAALNMGEYFETAERYARLALKAQANSRATLEALAKLHQPREQTVKHVHVNEGGQAVVADQFHQHNRGTENEKSDKQSNATGKIGKSAALLSSDASGNGVPISSREGEKAMPDARGD